MVAVAGVVLLIGFGVFVLGLGLVVFWSVCFEFGFDGCLTGLLIFDCRVGLFWFWFGRCFCLPLRDCVCCVLLLLVVIWFVGWKLGFGSLLGLV